ncbi:MAG: RNA polymerase sigma factor WhiG, partial [Deltaproteobacteria bacterium]|nr:RNA polymerase sigma factor WhiG [Deltaproteobacteria bacterium]
MSCQVVLLTAFSLKSIYLSYELTKMVDKKKRDKLIMKYAPLVKNIVGRIAIRLPDHVSKDDLINAGIMGLMSALE